MKQKKITQKNFLSDSLVIIPFSVPWNWSTDYNNQTVKILSRNNFVICLFKTNSFSIKEAIQKKVKFKLFFNISKNIIGFNYLQPIPFKRFAFIRNLNDYICSLILLGYVLLLSMIKNYKKRYIWFFDTYWYKIFIFLRHYFYTIYDCVDYHLDLTFIPKQLQKDRKKEEFNMIQKVNLFTVNSRRLYSIFKKVRNDLILVPQGFRLDSFEKYFLTKKTKKENKKMIIGFVGGINNRLDYDLLLKLVSQNSELTFIFWGQIQDLTEDNLVKKEKLFSYSNVFSGLSKNKDKVPNIIDKFDIGIIPYNIKQEFNKYCYPMKIFEYFYLGKPVISTSIEELKYFPKFIKIGNSVNAWEKYIKYFLSNKFSESYIDEMQSLAIANSWEEKVSLICLEIKKDLNKK